MSIPKEYRENAIIELKEVKGGHEQIDRVFYASEGKMYRKIHSGHHANPKQYQYGKLVNMRAILNGKMERLLIVQPES